MQANKNINNLFNGFEKEFGKGDWNGIESRVLDNNRKFIQNKSKFKIGVFTGLAACLALGLIHFNTSTFNSPKQVERAEQNTPKVSPVVENKQLSETNENELIAEKPSKMEIDVPIEKSAKSSNSFQSKKLEPVIRKESQVPVNETVSPDLPKFVLHKTTYCVGEKPSFMSDYASSRDLSVKWNTEIMTIEQFKQMKLSSAGTIELKVLENDKVIQEHIVVCQSPEVGINYKKNYNIDNPYVQFNAMKVAENTNYDWYVDGEPIATADKFEYTFASKGIYKIKMVVRSSSGCMDSSFKTVRILRGYNLMATTVYNPEVGKWLPLGLKKEGLAFKLRIIDQEGHTIFTSNNAKDEWDGSISENNHAVNGDLFYWVAQVTDSNGKINEYGNSLLINSKLE